MKKKIGVLCALALALVLEILPYGAVCVFANPEGRAWRHTYSYFDLTPFGYANFAPFVVALLTCALVVLVLISMVKKKKMTVAIRVGATVATVLSVAPLLYGIRFFSIVGAMISVSLALAAGMAWGKEG